ncbi:MAG: Crp/Fnr family transcriptional regulator, partial [Pseudomonadota bacterium]
KGIYGISNGSVSIGVPADDGQEVVIYHTGKWFWVGDLELLANGPRIASVVAAGPTDCLFLPIGQVRQLVKDQPDFLHEFYRMSYQNGRMIMRALANMTVPGSAKRVALRLLQYHQASCSEGDWIMISQTQLAQTTALSPATLQRVIKRLVAMDILEVGYGKLRILDLERLSGLLEA